MPTLTTTEHGETYRAPPSDDTNGRSAMVASWMTRARAAYIEKARRRLAAGPTRPSDAVIVLASGTAQELGRDNCLVIKVRHSLPARRPIFFAFPGGPPWVRNKAIFLGYFR
jgi:hypothetical protein